MKERLAHPAAKKFQEEMSAHLPHITIIDIQFSLLTLTFMNKKHSNNQVLLKNCMKIENHAVLNQDQIAAGTRMQLASELWCNARKLRITASIMKEMS